MSAHVHVGEWCAACVEHGVVEEVVRRRGDAAPRAATEPPTPADFDAMSPAEFDAYLVRNGMDARIKAALAEPVTEPLTDPDARICRRYFTGTITLCKVHGHPSARCEDWEAGYRAALTPTSAPEPGS